MVIIPLKDELGRNLGKSPEKRYTSGLIFVPALSDDDVAVQLLDRLSEDGLPGRDIDHSYPVVFVFHPTEENPFTSSLQVPTPDSRRIELDYRGEGLAFLCYKGNQKGGNFFPRSDLYEFPLVRNKQGRGFTVIPEVYNTTSLEGSRFSKSVYWGSSKCFREDGNIVPGSVDASLAEILKVGVFFHNRPLAEFDSRERPSLISFINRSILKYTRSIDRTLDVGPGERVPGLLV